MIEVEKVSKDYGRVRALTDVSFQVKRGEIVGLLGPNGAGKTTLLKVLTGYFEPSEGLVRIGGLDVTEDPVSVRRQIGYLPENAPLYPEMLVQESLLMTAELRELDGSVRDRLLERAIRSAGLVEVLTRPIGKLSKGYRQRVGLAQAILAEPSILILDEPTSGLDPDQIVEVRKLIQQLATHSTVILSTHILSEVEQTCERVLVLMGGRLRADAKLADLMATNRYRVVFADGPQPDMLRAALADAPGVRAVAIETDNDGPTTLSVEGDADVDLGQVLFEQAKANDWPLRELHRNTRTLESVFRTLSAGKEVQL